MCADTLSLPGLTISSSMSAVPPEGSTQSVVAPDWICWRVEYGMDTLYSVRGLVRAVTGDASHVAVIVELDGDLPVTDTHTMVLPSPPISGDPQPRVVDQATWLSAARSLPSAVTSSRRTVSGPVTPGSPAAVLVANMMPLSSSTQVRACRCEFLPKTSVAVVQAWSRRPAGTE
jgi:hypothetical protein